MRQLQAASFAVDDLKLYLDTHPTDPRALEQYCRCRDIHGMVAAKYVAEVGPLTAEDVPCDGRWTWVDAPWPWEGEV